MGSLVGKMTPYEELDALYATLPTVECKRLCQDYCGPILIPKIEAKRLEDKRGHLTYRAGFVALKRVSLPAPEIIEKEFIGLTPGPDMACVFLAPAVGTCMAYGIRPLVCRCWGLVDHPLLRCPHGCRPSRWIGLFEYKELNLKVIEIQRRQV